MPFIEQGGTTDPAVTYVQVLDLQRDPIDPDADTLTLTIYDTNGDALAGFPITYPHAGFTRLDVGQYGYAWAVPSDETLGEYPWLFEGSVGGVALPTASLAVEVIPAGSLSTFLTVDDVRALVDCKQTDAQLQSILDREISWLTNRIGPLTGARTQTFYLPAEREQFYIEPSGYALDRPRLPYPYMIRDVDAESPLILYRQASSVSAVTDNGAAVTTRLLSLGWKVEKTTGPWLGPTMAVTYTPADQASVEKVVIELVRLTVIETGFVQEKMGDYMYNRRAGTTEPVAAAAVAREALVRTILHPAIPRTMRLRSSALSDRVGAAVP